MDTLTKAPITITRIVLIFIAGLSPFLITLFLVYATGHSLTSLVPYYVGGDAVARYDYVRNIIEHGHILGYNGYDYVLAKIPEYGSAWGLFWALPYIAFGKLFGWSLNAPIIANITWLCLANLIFVYLVRPSNRQLIHLTIVTILLYINIDYSISGMSEPSRYAITIILVGMLYRMASIKTSKLYRYIIVPLMIVFGASTFILISAFIIPYFIILLKDAHLHSITKGSISLFVFVIVTLIIKRTNSLFCTPYYQAFNIKKDAAAFHDGGLVHGLKAIIRNTYVNFRSFDLIQAYTSIHYEMGKYSWFIVTCWILLLFISYLLISKKFASKRDTYIAIGALYLLLIITVGYLVLYNNVMPTLVRGINTGLCGAVILSTLMDSRKVMIVYIAMALLWAPGFALHFNQSCDAKYRCMDSIQRSELHDRQEIAAQYIKLDKSTNNPWDNTVAICYGGKIGTAFVVPSGVGKISMHNITLNEKSKYVLIGTNGKKDDIQETINNHLANGHKLLVTTSDFTILEKQQ